MNELKSIKGDFQRIEGSPDHYIYRFSVPGGWIYVIDPGTNENGVSQPVSSVFVPMEGVREHK